VGTRDQPRERRSVPGMRRARRTLPGVNLAIR
jgi:hypothetical protein